MSLNNFVEYRAGVLDRLSVDYTAEDLRNFERWRLKVLEGLSAIYEGDTMKEKIIEAVDDWLDDHPEATTTVEDGAIATAKLAASAVTTGKIADGAVTDAKLAANGIKAEVADLKTDLKNTNSGVSNLGLYGTFVQGGLSSGVVQTSQKFRVASSDIITVDRTTILYIASGFKIGVHTFVNGSFSTDSGWQQNVYTIPAGTSFRIVIGRTSDDTSEVANIGLFVNQVIFSTVIGNAIHSATDVKLLTLNGRSTFELYGSFAQGGLHENGSIFPSQHHRVSSITHIVANRELQVYVASGYKCGYITFASGQAVWHGWYTDKFTIPKGSEFVLQICNNPEDSSVYADVETYVNAITFDAFGISEKLMISKSQMVMGSLQPSAWSVVWSKPWLTYFHKMPVSPNTSVTVMLPNIEGVTWRFRHAWYDSNGDWIGNSGDVASNVCNLPNTAYYYAFSILATNNGTADSTYDLMSHFPDDEAIIVDFGEISESLAPTKAVIQWGYNTFVSKPSNVIDGGYYTNGDLLKHKLYAEKLGGSLLCEQAFCIYDDKFYSVEEGKLGIQDESFNTIETVDLSFGHGNSIQLGSSNLAYINGTSDHTVYVLNLDTKEIVDTISLPFNTGVDSAVIDDVNNIAYILHSETSGEVYSSFALVAYDLTNEEVLYTKYLPFKILQFQATDFYEGKILLLAGTNDNVDNRLFILDLNGTALANMKLSIFASDEPEGVFFDRNNGDLYVSSYNKKVYKLIPLA